MPIFDRLTGGFRSPGEKKTNLAKMGLPEPL